MRKNIRNIKIDDFLEFIKNKAFIKKLFINKKKLIKKNYIFLYFFIYKKLIIKI